MSKVSVIIPIYNPGKRLNKCIKSVLNQTFRDFELILVNDGSTDDSLNLCKKFKEIDKRIIIIDKKNEGSITARRVGIEASKYEYVMFVDADDWIHQKCIEIMYDQTINSSSDITVCNIYKVLGNSSLIKQKNTSSYFDQNKIFNKDEIIKKLVVAYFHGHPFPSSLCAKLYKRKVLLNSGKYLKRITFLGEDLFYNLEIFLKVNKVAVITKPLYFYRLGGYTNKYMPYLFDDMINGYQIQREVIDEFYKDTVEHEYNGINIMLLNTFKTCLYNLFNSNLSSEHIRKKILDYVSNETLLISTKNEGAIAYFPEDYLLAIMNKDIDYLYDAGRNSFIKAKPKKFVKSILSRILIII